MLGISNSHKILLSHFALLIAAQLLVPVAFAQDSDQPTRIHRYAAFSPQALSSARKTTNALSNVAIPQRTQVNVFGKQLVFSLVNNDRLTESPAAHRVEALRGSIEGKPKSWVRLTYTSDGTHGLIWDGTELYAVEPAADIGSALATTLPAPTSDTVIFKLSDVTLDLGADYCGSGSAHASTTNTGLATYQALSDELSASMSTTMMAEATATDSSPTLRLEMQALADAAFRAEYSSDQAALDAVLVRLNNIDGIFSAQIGLEVQATDIQIYSADPTALSSSTNADTLLSSLGKMRSNTASMSSYGATHLFTGRDLDGDTLGIAYIGNLCGKQYGTSLSEIRDRGAWIDSLVAAHELGHQLGAVHDGTGVCSSTPAQGYLMSAQINGSSELSQCSRQSILATMQSAACLVPVGPPDVGVTNATIETTTSTRLDWSLPIQNTGTGRANLPTIHVTLPANVIVDSSAIAGGSCNSSNDSNGGQIDCAFDSLAANETRSLAITLYSNAAGTYPLMVNVSVADDNNPLNNSATINLVVANTATGTATASANGGSQGGGGVFNLGFNMSLLAFATLIGLGRRHRTQAALRGHITQPLR